MNVTEKRVRTFVGAVLLLWLVFVCILGANHAFIGAPGALPLPILAGFLMPILVFLAAFWTVGPFRDFVMSIDLPVMAGIQAWRFGGLGSIALFAHGVLPGLFAWPAGLGDMAIGLTAPLVVLALRRQPTFATGKLFRVWNLLGLLDLIVAVGLGAMCAVLGIGISDEIKTFPGGIAAGSCPDVPGAVFLMLHLASLLQARRMGMAGRACAWTEPTIRCEPIEAMHKV